MDKKYKKKAAGLIGLTVLSCATMFVSLTAAWFTTITQAQTATQGFQVSQDDSLEVGFEVYEYDEDNLTGKVAVDRTVLDEDQNPVYYSKFALPQYDSFIPERNIHNNKVLRVEVTSKGTTDSSSKFSLSVPCSGSFLDKDDMVTRNMSNIIGFKYFLKHELANPSSLNEGTAGSIYDDSIKVFNTINDTKSYVALNNVNGQEVGAKVENNTIVFENLDIDENASDSKTILYLEYFYKENLVDYYFEHSNDEKATADNLESYSISFNCDIVKLQFSGGSN